MFRVVILFFTFGTMQKKFRYLISLGLLGIGIPFLYAQKGYIDSLKTRLREGNASAYEKVVIHCKLARASFEVDLEGAFRHTDEADAIAGSMTDGSGKAWVYATRIHLHVQKKHMQAAYAALDSALLYLHRSADSVARGMVWLRNGWLDLVENENDLAVPKLLRAAECFKSGGADEYVALTYHYLASIYGYGVDVERQQDYATQCYMHALRSGEVDALNTAYFTMGQYFYDRYKLNDGQADLLDSTLSYYARSIQLSDRRKDRVLVRSNTAAVALNTANSYFQHYPPSYSDSVYHYLAIAERISSETGLTEILVNCYAMRSEYALQAGNVQESEQLLLKALGQVETSVVEMPLAKARIYRALARVAEHRKDTEAALRYLKNYVTSNQEAFDQEREANAQRIDARYRSAQQEQKIALLEQEAAFREKRTLLYIGLGIVGFVALALLLVSYNYKLKASLRKQKLVDKEKAEAELKAKLKEAETNQLLAEQALLKERQDRLEKELLVEQLRKEEKNQLMELLAGKKSSESGVLVDDQIKRMIKQQQKLDRDYDEHKADFLEVNPAFFDRLQRCAGDSLTRLDLKYCSYILMGLSNKEISARLGIEPKSIRMARYRIKQKLGLGKDEGLDQFILSQA